MKGNSSRPGKVEEFGDSGKISMRFIMSIKK